MRIKPNPDITTPTPPIKGPVQALVQPVQISACAREQIQPQQQEAAADFDDTFRDLHYFSPSATNCSKVGQAVRTDVNSFFSLWIMIFSSFEGFKLQRFSCLSEVV